MQTSTRHMDINISNKNQLTGSQLVPPSQLADSLYTDELLTV